MSTPPPPLRRSDYLLLAAYCLALFGFAVLFDRSLTIHETVHCVNVREMALDGDLVIPHYGGRPWLERPPLPFWLTLPVVQLLGDVPAAYRVPPLLVATGCVFLVAWMASVWFGRAVGLLSGLALATIREFTHYATAPECDMFLCGVVTLALALFVHLEFRRRPAVGEGGIVGRRPWAVAAFFVVLGLTNVVKGLVFGDLFVLLPVAAFLLLGADRWSLVRRYVWLPGWLLFAAAAGAWAVAAYLRYPDVVELWKSDYAGRFNQGFMREPPWYYLAQLPWILFPWTIVAGVGLATSWPRVLGQGRTAERFLWCWALVPVAFFSLPQGKHHHYLLHALAPWAVLAALGTVRLAQYLPTVRWLRTPWPALVGLGLPGEAALWGVSTRYHLPGWFLPAAAVVWPALVLAGWWIAAQPDLLRGSIALFALVLPLHWFGHAAEELFHDRYSEDRAFVERVLACVPAGGRVLVGEEIGPLDASWMLFYLDGRGEQLHNLTFLRDGRLRDAKVYVIARRLAAGRLQEYGESKVVFESRHSRDEGSGPEHRFGLYRLRFHDRLARHEGKVYISPMQATGRAPGPQLR